MIQWEFVDGTFVTGKENEIVIEHQPRSYRDVSWKALPRHDVLTLAAWLVEWGRHCWELVTCALAESLGHNGDPGNIYPVVASWRGFTFCVFKLPVEGANG